MIDAIVLFVIALVANFFSALAGGGTGLLQLPALIFLGLPFAVALATHKVATVALGLGASLQHIGNSAFLLKHSLMIMLIGLPAVVLGSLLVINFPERPAQIALGLLTVGLGVYSWAKPELGQQELIRTLTLKRIVVACVGIALVGFLNGSLASGTGLFLTVWLIRCFGFDYQRAAAHTLVWVGLFWNGVGATTLGLIGHIHWPWLLPLIIGSFLGGYFGARMGAIKGNRWVKRAFEVMTIATGCSLVFRALVIL